MSARCDKLFVYGTLRRGFPMHSELQKLNAPFAGKGRIAGALFDLGDYPGAVPSSSIGADIEGEVYELKSPARQLAVLDKIEEFDSSRPSKSLFVRRRATVRLDNGRRIRAWVYFLPKRPTRAQIIPSGDYAELVNSNR
jgi:pyruvate carboxylase